jgi:HlyD family secretion protein
MARISSPRWIWILVLAAVAGAAAFFIFRKETPRIQYRSTPLERGDITAKVTASGILSALVTVQVGSQVSGRVQAIFADFNSKVKKGQLIAKIDPLLFEAAIRQADANRSAALGNLEKARAQELEARRQYERLKPLAERKLLSASELDTAEANWVGAKAQIRSAQGALAQAEAALYQARINRQYTNIYSPINGIVISRNVDIGQTVAASLQAPTLFVIAEDLAKMQVDTSVAEADIGKITTGMETIFTVDAYPNERFRGTVRQVRNAAQSVQNIVTYNAVVDVANPDLKLKPGMTANVTFILGEKNDVLRVPTTAFRFTPSFAKPGGGAGGEASHDKGSARRPRASRDEARKVWVLKDKAVAPAPVTVQTGITDGVYSELVSGDLHEGDRIVTDENQGQDKGGASNRPPRMF